MSWLKAKCPECGKTFDQWEGLATFGSGGITFDEDGKVDLGDLIVTDATLLCPNPKCSFMLDDAGSDELEEWFEEHEVGDSEKVKG